MKNTLLATVAATLLSVAVIAQPSPILGFSKAAADKQLSTEKKFDGNLNAKNVDQFIKDLSAVPHHVASPGGDANAAYILNKFKSWGYDAQIETFYVLFPTPVTRELSMTGNRNFKASLKEPVLKEDATSGQTATQLPVYNCWSADGDVTSELVFVNYGVPADYEMLARMGIDVKGKIVIAKYGQSWRGIKPIAPCSCATFGLIPRQLSPYLAITIFPFTSIPILASIS